MHFQCLVPLMRLWLLVQWLPFVYFFIGKGHAMTNAQITDLKYGAADFQENRRANFHRQEAEHMFYHGYDNYMKYAFPEDELRPISCTPLTRDRANAAHIELNDALGNYSLTLIDSLSTLAILASSSSTSHRGKNKALAEFKKGIRRLVEQYGDGTETKSGHGKRGRGFDVDSKVQVFETVIRGVGGLLSAHLFAVGDLPIAGYDPRAQKGTEVSAEGDVQSVRWSRNFNYDGQLLRLAYDLGKRLLPAFHTVTGLPYPRVNLRDGVPFYHNSPLNQNAEDGQCSPNQHPPGALTETCSAGAGSLVLEFTTLSRLTGDLRFEQLAKRAFWAVWERKSAIGLIGAGIDAESGQWMSPYTGIGAGIDSFYEYAAKASILLSGSPSPAELAPKFAEEFPNMVHAQLVTENLQTADAFQTAWEESHSSIRRHLRRGSGYTHAHYIQGDLFTGAVRAYWVDSLSAFYPGLLSMTGDLEEAIEAHLLNTALWTRYSALPERWSSHTGGIEGGLTWWGGRPEFIESTYHIYRATQDPWYLHVGEMVLRDIKRRCWTKCGWSGIQDVRSGEQSDRMESFFLGETTKYLFLLFDADHPLNKLDAPFVFSTEGHPLIIPRRGAKSSPKPQHFKGEQQSFKFDHSTCPKAPSNIPFSVSPTAARLDVFHAAKLARLHLMPTMDTLESPLVEYSSDHPSISISDVRSPSNFTYFPWTLPLELVPYNGMSSPILQKPTFDISFPPNPNVANGPGILQRVGNGILVNSLSGVRLGMIQDVPHEMDNEAKNDQYRVQAINNILMGKDERIFVAKNTANDIISPTDPNFTRIRDAVLLDLLVDVEPLADEIESFSPAPTTINETKASITPVAEVPFDDDEVGNSESIQRAFSALIRQVASLIGSDAPQPEQFSTKDYPREYIPAILPMGPGAAPLPDFEDALGPDIRGAPQGSLLWTSIYLTDRNCNGKLPVSIPKDTQIIVMRRGSCSFAHKLQNIPTFVPSTNSLQLVVVISSDEDDEGSNVPAGYLIRPFLEGAQTTSRGFLRHNPIPMIMVAGGDVTYEILRRAKGVGVKRRYSVEAQGVPISNLVIL